MNESWPEIELSELRSLTSDEASLLEMHSVLNTISLLVGELNIIGHSLTGDMEWMHEALATCQRMINALRDREQALRCASEIGSYRRKVARDVEFSLSRLPANRNDPGLIESLANIDSIFEVLSLRAREILARSMAPEKWELFQVPELQRDFRSFFLAIEKNSKGRYRIAFNQPRQSRSDYEVNLALESPLGEELFMPPVMVDVMRDLMANARKYSFPGASITGVLRQDAKMLSFIVKDTGRGIPQNELQSVVQFGIRGSNAGDVRTYGGGFGLTKALCVTVQFHGKMWLASQVGKGTRIKIELPMPGK